MAASFLLCAEVEYDTMRKIDMKEAMIWVFWKDCIILRNIGKFC